VRVHLLGQLSSELDGLYLRTEGATEDSLDETFYPTLEVA